MLNQRTCALLSTLSGISNTCILKYPVTIINDESKSIVAKVNIEAIEDAEFEAIGLNNKITNLTSMISMMEDPVITRVDNILCIRDETNKIETQFVTDSIEILNGIEFKEESFNRVEESLSVVSFKLTTDDISRLKTANGVYSELSDVIFSTDGGLTISLGAQGKFNSSNNKFSITKDVESKKEFTCAVSFDALQRIPKVNYDVEVKYSERKNRYALVLKCEALNTSIILSTLVR